MLKRTFILVLFGFLAVSAIGAKKDKNLLRDGFVLRGVDGKLVARGQWWSFELERAVSDGRAVVKAGTRLPLLPSTGLEKMVAGLKEHPGGEYRLYNAMATRYDGSNYIFADYFLPLTGSEDAKPKSKADANEVTSSVPINEEGDAVIIPEEIIEKLKTRRVVRPEKLGGKFDLKQDSILVDRTGYIKKLADGTKVFAFDALGRNVQQVKLQLLPCEAIEKAERKQARHPERLRFKVAGIVTKYKGRYYLLLQRVTRVYSYGNFGR